MKKTYISPKTKAVKISICRMICISNGTLDKSQTIDKASGFGARQFGGFIDDEEE